MKHDNTQTRFGRTPVCLLICSLTLLAQVPRVLQAEDWTRHPLLEDKFEITAGAFRTQAGLKVSASASSDLLANDIDFDDTLGVDDKTTTFHGGFRWNFGEKWSFAAEYFGTSGNGEATLLEDIEWQDGVFRAGSFVGAGVKSEVTRLFFGRKFSTGPQYEFGLGLGLHNYRIKTYIEGELFVNDETTGFRREEASTSQPLPNLGAWYRYSPSKRWLIDGRVDFFSASVGDYDGTLWNAMVGVNYQFVRNFGIALHYQYFDIDLDVDKDDWNGQAKVRYSGPILSVTASW